MMVRSPISDIRVCGRSAQGVRLVRMDEGTTLVSVSIADAEEVADIPVPVAVLESSASDAETPTETSETTE
jgi:DNA gyrase/topoisomerase IV subunit A